MIAAELITELRSAGFQIRSAAGRLLVRPPLAEEARAIVQEHRDIIVAEIEEEARQIRAAIAEIACVRRWSEDDLAEAMEVAERCPEVADWIALRDLVRATAALPTEPTLAAGWELVDPQLPAWLDDVPEDLRRSLITLMETNDKFAEENSR